MLGPGEASPPSPCPQRLGGPGDPSPRGLDAADAGAAGTLGLASGRQARPSQGRGAFWERPGALELTNGQGPGPTQSAFLPLLQTFYKFRLPGPLGARAEGMGWPSGDRGPERSTIVPRSLCSDKFSGEKNVLPQEQFQPPAPTSDPAPSSGRALQGFSMRTGSTSGGAMDAPQSCFQLSHWAPPQEA